MKLGIDSFFNVWSLKTFQTSAPFVDVFGGCLRSRSL
jgi:hypothetical protein